MRLLSVSFVLGLLLVAATSAQLEGNIWYFGQDGAGIDFNGCRTEVLTNGRMQGFEGVASIADRSTGEFLFCTNSENVWDRRQQIMPNGNLHDRANSITQVLIVPLPGSTNIYYIFSSAMQGEMSRGVRYHIVDMNLNGGFGDLTRKNVHLYDPPVTEKLTALRHRNSRDVWIIGHEAGTSTFFAFLLTGNGISAFPVKKSIGKIHELNLRRSNWDAIGELKASPDGRMLALATYDLPDIELFDFDNRTGTISNRLRLPERGGAESEDDFSRLYGVSFSPDNSKLYVTVSSPGTLIQYDLSSKDPEAIRSSKQIIFRSEEAELYSLKTAPDGKIYGGGQFRSHLAVINNPNLSGKECDFDYNGLYLMGLRSGWGLNNLMELPPQIVSMEQVDLGNDTTICQGESLLLDATLPGATYRWQDGSKEALLRVDSDGSYWVARTVDDCTVRDTIRVTVRKEDTRSLRLSLPHLTLSHDLRNVHIPLTLDVDTTALPMHISSLRLSISVDSALFLPRGASRGISREIASTFRRRMEIELEDIEIRQANQIVTELLGIAVLDTLLSSELRIESVEIAPSYCSRITTSIDNGSLSLEGCLLESRLLRMFNPTALHIRSDPASTTVDVQVVSEESGNFALHVFNALGGKVTSKFWRQLLVRGEAPRRYDLSLTLDTLPGGTYFVVLHSPLRVVSSRLLVTR